MLSGRLSLGMAAINWVRRSATSNGRLAAASVAAASAGGNSARSGGPGSSCQQNEVEKLSLVRWLQSCILGLCESYSARSCGNGTSH